MARPHPLVLILLIILGLALHLGVAQARNIQTAILAGGCFWCVEADFDQVDGVVETTSGFIGGTLKNPSEARIAQGGTGYYESVRIRFDADVISYRRVVDIFWRTIDPLDAGGQFCDRGPTYQTAVFVQGKAQHRAAVASKAAADAVLKGKVVTKILPAGQFYPAKAFQQNYHLGKNRIWTRFGFIPQDQAYKAYRKACGRDRRVHQIWGKAAPFSGF